MLEELQRKDLLNLAILLHDVGKSARDDDHSSTGARMAQAFLKRLGVSPEEMLNPNSHPRTRLEGQIYRRYQEMLKGCNALDFEDILNLTLELFEKHPEAIREVTSRFRYVMVDEYQDTNAVQYRLLRHLVEPHRNCLLYTSDAADE